AGGACLYEEGSDLANMLSQELVLRIRWPERTDMVLSRIVGVSRNTHRHIQFLNLSAFTERQIKSLVQVGSIGQKISQVLPIKNSPVQLDVSELWTGVHGDGLIFFVNREISAELNMAGRRLRFFKGAKPSILDQSGSER